MKKIIFILLGISVAVSGVARSDNFDPSYSGGLDTTIDQVLMRGLWTEGEKYGSWRLVSRNLGWEHTRSYLYLQWLLIDEDKQEQVEIKTVPVTEFNDKDWRHLQKIEYKDDVFIVTYVLRIDLDTEKKAFLKPGEPGKYTISFEK